MSITNLLINYIAFSDTNQTNNPSQKLADITLKSSTSCSGNISTQNITLEPGMTANMFSSARAITFTPGTQLSIAPTAIFNTYRVTADSQIFRVSRRRFDF